MAKEFVRKIRNTVLTGKDKEPLYTNKPLDLFNDKEDNAYIRLFKDYHNLTDNIKQVHSENGSIIFDKYDKNNVDLKVEVGGANLIPDDIFKRNTEIDTVNSQVSDQTPPGILTTGYTDKTYTTLTYVTRDSEINEKGIIISAIMYNPNNTESNGLMYIVESIYSPQKETIIGQVKEKLAPYERKKVIIKLPHKYINNPNNPAGSIRLHYSTVNKNDSRIEFRYVKVETGSVATSWTPSIYGYSDFTFRVLARLKALEQDNKKLNNNILELDKRVEELEKKKDEVIILDLDDGIPIYEFSKEMENIELPIEKERPFKLIYQFTPFDLDGNRERINIHPTNAVFWEYETDIPSTNIYVGEKSNGSLMETGKIYIVKDNVPSLYIKSPMVNTAFKIKLKKIGVKYLG